MPVSITAVFSWVYTYGLAMSKQTSLILDLIRFSLQILQARLDDFSVAAVDDRSLLLYRVCQKDNYSEAPIEIDKVIGLFPFVCAEVERDPRFHALCRDLATDRRLRKLTMPDGAIIPGTEICLGSGVLISILWRYLNITKQLSWDQGLLDVLLSESEQTLDRGSLRVDVVLPLMGLSGGYLIPRIDLDQGWYVREMRPEEHTIFSKHIRQEIKLPRRRRFCGMLLSGNLGPYPSPHWFLPGTSLIRNSFRLTRLISTFRCFRFLPLKLSLAPIFRYLHRQSCIEARIGQ